MRVAITALLVIACGDNLKVVHDPCPANPYDRLRYTTLLSNGPGLTQGDARTACQRRGEDLAILSDAQELAGAIAETITPAWVDGHLDPMTLDWITESGCTTYLPWEPTAPVPVAGPSCIVLDGAQRFANMSCGDQAYDGQPLTALCETPYTGTCEAAGPLAFTLHTDRIEAGRAACAATGGHLVRIDSSAELAAATQLAQANGVTTFWLDPVFDHNAWSSPDGCPSILPWAGDQPDLTEPPRCVIYDLSIGGAETVRCDSVVTATICEGQGP